MKVIFVHNRYQSLGGEDLAAKVEREILQRHGHTVDLFEADNAEIVGLAGKAKAALGTVYSPDSRRKLAERIRSLKPNIVHVLNFFPLLSPSVHYACREAGVPVVQKISNFRLICPGALLLRDGRVCEDCVGRSVPWPGVLHACYRDSRAGSAVVATMLATHHLLGTWKKAVDAYIARTNFSREKLIEGGLPAERISIVPSFAPDPGEPSNGNGRFAFFAGRLSPEKGITTLLQAWERLDGAIPLKVAGDGPLKEEVARYAARGCVEYLGSLTRGQVQALMREAALLVFPSVCYENFPLSIVEAFAGGVPVVASKLGAMGEIIEDRRTGLLFKPGDPEDLAATVEWAVRHPEQMARMRREARAEYLAKYTPERNYELLMQIYCRIADEKIPANAALQVSETEAPRTNILDKERI
jgi:glycosyltransferase involved in cell wall biosynthesis